MEEFFIIGVKRIDSSWSIGDLKEENNAFDYCLDVLDIPEECMIDASLGHHGLEISVTDIDTEEDWYIQLHRVSTSMRKSA